VGFLESLRQSADELAQRAAEAGRVGAARLEEVAARRRVEALLRELGTVTYAEHTGRGTPDSADQVARLVAAVRAEETRAETAAQAADEAMRTAASTTPRPNAGGAADVPSDVAHSAGPMGTAPPVPPDDDSPLL
jgi:hypothetical protein